MATALLLEQIHPEAARTLKLRGFSVREMPRALDEDELCAALDGVDVLGVRSQTAVSARVLDAAPGLRAIGAFCIGTNQLDLAAAANRGVAVFNAPYSNTRSVVELTVANILALSRRLGDANRDMHDGLWKKTAVGSHEIRGQVLGIVGYGSIGAQLSVAAEALGMRVVFYDIHDKLALGNAQRLGSLEELLSVSDVVTFHVDGRPDNQSLINEETISQMRQGSYLINASRGFVMDSEAVAAAVRDEHLGGVAVDVFEREPDHSPQMFESCLRGLPNTILTPHIGGSTEEAQCDIGQYVAAKLGEFIDNGSTLMCLNLPQVSLSGDRACRVVHIHESLPGALARLNDVFGCADLNIVRQTLGTHGSIGLVLSELVGSMTPQVMQDISQLPGTVRAFRAGVSSLNGNC